ncbi:MAG: GNAT family N-acetyltransferase [Caulobacterales bacterium]|nr:GNAT family N-acetyltransferase [Caulobacterales bacterium]
MSAPAPSMDRALAEALPAIHERQNVQECRNLMGAEQTDGALRLREFDGGATASCNRRWPDAEAQNLISGLAPGDLSALDEVLAWIDGEGGGAHMRVGGQAIDRASSAPLIERGFTLIELEVWLWASVADVAGAQPRVELRPARAGEELAVWAATGCAGWEIAEERRAEWSASLAPSPPPDHWRHFVAFRDGAPAGAALLTLEDHEGAPVGYLADGSVAPAHRGHGLQRDLIAARAAAARDEGVEVLFAGAKWGSASHRNMERCGLRTAQASALWWRAPRS